MEWPRPIAGPSVIPWDRILDLKFVEVRLNAQVGKTPEKRCRVKEWEALAGSATYLESTEWQYLDEDGETTQIRKLLHEGWFDDEIDRDIAKDFKVKYAPLLPTGYAATPLGMFEAKYLDEDGGRSGIEANLRSVWDFLSCYQKCHELEIQMKYGELGECYAWHRAEYQVEWALRFMHNNPDKLKPK